MLVKNLKPCLIELNHEGALYKLMPIGCAGDSVEVPDSIQSVGFFQRLVKAGHVWATMPEPKPAEKAVIDDGDEKGQLIAQLADIGIKADRRWSVEKLTQTLTEAENNVY